MRLSTSDDPRGGTAAELFETQAAVTPDAVALEAGGEQLTYRRLNAHANQLAHLLRDLGVGPEIVVGIVMERSREMILALLAISKAGGAYVALAPDAPDERLAFMIRDTGLTVLLTQRHLRRRLQRYPVRVVCPGAERQLLERQPRTDPPRRDDARNLIYVCFTSGSTGRPKGVAVAHRGVTRLVKQANYAELTSHEVFLQLCSLSFDVSTFEIWGCLLNGGRLVVFPGGLPSLPELARTVRLSRITTLWLSAGLFHQMVERHPEALGSLRQLLAGGDILSPPHARKALEHLDDGVLINGYGPTENTTFTSCHSMRESGDVDGSVSIGRAITGTNLDVHDGALQAVPSGEIGELCTGGDGVARGYLNRPGRTAVSFVPDPGSDRPGDRLYRTGDLAQGRPDGTLAFHGRFDHQVKVRGFRVELGEIESALAGHEGVREAAVLALRDPAQDKRLVAYVAADPRRPPTVPELRRYLGQRLPDYMVPAAFVFLDRLPLNRSGKVDRRALPDPGSARPELEQPYVAPATPIEKTVAELWSELLAIERIGAHDNLFELGGHSLLATRMLARLDQSFATELSISELFDAPTVAAVAQRLGERRARGQGGEAPEALRPMPRDGDIPLSFPQQQVWFLQHLVPDSLAYNFQALLGLRGALHVEALRRSLQEIVRRHEIFRTTFPSKQGRPVQEVQPPPDVPLPIIDLSGLDEARRRTEAERRRFEAYARPFDLDRLPLIYWALFRLTPTEHELLHVEYHLVHDGWSFNVFLGELVELYEAYASGRPSPLPELPLQFADFALWQHRWIESEEARRQIGYWQERLAEPSPPLNLPFDRPRPPAQTLRGTSLRIELPGEQCDALRALSRRYGVTLYMTLLSAFLTLLYRYTRQHDVSVGCGIANRRSQIAESLTGMLLNMVVLRHDLSRDPLFPELLDRVRQVTREAYAHQEVPFDKLVEVLKPVRDASYNPFFQIAFSFHDSPLDAIDLPDLELDVTVALSNRTSKFDLNVIGIPTREQHAGQAPDQGSSAITQVWEYSTDLFDEATIRRMVGHYRTLLDAILVRPDRRLSELPLLPELERRDVLEAWNDTASPYPRQASIQEVFEARVEAAPAAVAVAFEETALTYSELNRRANRLAHRLRALGAEAEVPIGVCLERSVEMIVALLGILKAGGAYVPLDPTYPAERLSFLLEDTAVPIIVSRRQLADRLPEHGAELLCLEGDRATLDRQSGENPSREDPTARTAPENLAYVMYTSGSTGRPKGVAVSHRGVVRLVREPSFPGFTAEDVTLQLAPVAFDASTLEIWGALLNGARLTILPGGIPSLEQLAETLASRRVTTLHLTAGLFHQVVEENLESLAGVRHLLAGGDVLSVAHVRKVLSELPATHLIACYGPTENTTFTSCCPMDDPSLVGSTVSIGRPIADTRIYVLDPDSRPLPVGIAGELLTAGDGLARGYLGRPGRTAQRFVPDPWSRESGGRLYRTGDLVRWLPDGSLEFLGRFDHQVKLRGFRIELGEIESVLGRHDGVEDCVVVAHGTTSEDKQLVAYVTADGDSEPADGELRDALRRKLPDYMVPSAFLTLESLPLDPNGKIDRKALPMPEAATAAPKDWVAPRNEVEELLGRIWSDLIQRERVGIYDNFFDLGGHSLHATRLMHRVSELLGIELPVRTLYDAPTIEQLALRVEGKMVEYVEGMSDEEALNLPA